MKHIINKKVILLPFLILFFMANYAVAQDYKVKYDEKIKVNNDAIEVISDLLSYVCPKIIPATAKICDKKNQVGSAVKAYRYIKDDNNVLHENAANQLYDAVEQFKEHMPLREIAKESAANREWKKAFLTEEFAFQYLVKAASRVIFAKKMVDGE